MGDQQALGNAHGGVHGAGPTTDVEGAAAAHPGRSARVARVTVAGVETDLLVERFADRVVVVATQRDKLGSIVAAEWEGLVGGVRDDARGAFAVRVLAPGPDAPLAAAAARLLAGRMRAAGCAAPLLLAVAFRAQAAARNEDDPALVRELARAVEDNRVW